MRSQAMKVALLLLALVGALGVPGRAALRPNVIFILADDLTEEGGSPEGQTLKQTRRAFYPEASSRISMRVEGVPSSGKKSRAGLFPFQCSHIPP
jgi:hypothetical protein